MPANRESLLRKALLKDVVAQDELLQEYWDFVEQHLRNEAASPNDTVKLDIESVVQETFLQVFQELSDGGFVPPSNEQEALPAFEGWLRRIAMNRLIDARRMSEADKRGGGWRQVTNSEDAVLTSSQDVLDYLAQDNLTASRIVARKEAKSALESALMFLKEISDVQDKQYYDAFRLRFVEGRSIQEVAEELTCTEGQVRNLLRTAQNRLREHLGSLSLYISSRS